MGRRAQRTDIILLGGLAGEFIRVVIYRGLEKALETGIFLHRGSVENHRWGGVHSPEAMIVKRGLWKRASLSMGAL